MCGTTYSHLWHDSCIRWGMAVDEILCVWDEFTYMTCFIHMCAMSHSYVWHDKYLGCSTAELFWAYNWRIRKYLKIIWSTHWARLQLCKAIAQRYRALLLIWRALLCIYRFFYCRYTEPCVDLWGSSTQIERAAARHTAPKLPRAIREGPIEGGQIGKGVIRETLNYYHRR